MVREVVVSGPVYFGEDYLVPIPLLEVIDQLVPFGLEGVAPVTLLHVEVKEHEFVRLSVNNMVELFGALNSETLRIFPPLVRLAHRHVQYDQNRHEESLECHIERCLLI